MFFVIASYAVGRCHQATVCLHWQRHQQQQQHRHHVARAWLWRHGVRPFWRHRRTWRRRLSSVADTCFPAQRWAQYCFSVVNQWIVTSKTLMRKLRYFDLLWICCCTSPQQIEVVEFKQYMCGLYNSIKKSNIVSTVCWTSLHSDQNLRDPLIMCNRRCNWHSAGSLDWPFPMLCGFAAAVRVAPGTDGHDNVLIRLPHTRFAY